MVSRINRAVTFCGMAVWTSSIILSGHVSADDSLPNHSAVPLKVLILCGGGDHDLAARPAVLRRILADSGRFDVRVCESPIGLTARTLADFDVLVDDYAGPSLGSDTDRQSPASSNPEKALWSPTGPGFEAPELPRRSQADEPAASARTVPAYWPGSLAGDQERPIQFFQLKIVRAEHPIVRGIAGGFRTADAIAPRFDDPSQRPK